MLPKQVILLVEDDEDAASAMILALEMERYEVVWVQDACAAMAWVTANPDPLLIISDYRMKKNATTENGDALVEWMALKKIVVLLISGLPEEAKAACKKRGVSAPIIAKPFSYDPFIQAIHQMVEIKKDVAFGMDC